MAPISFEEFLLAAPQIARTKGPDPNLVSKFALIVATGGLILGYDRRLRHHRLYKDLAFQVYLLADLITFILGLLLMYRLMVAPPDSSSTTGNGQIATWVALFMSVITLALVSYLLIFANCHG